MCGHDNQSSLPDLIRQSMPHRRVSMDHRVKPGGDDLKRPASTEKLRSRARNRAQVLPIHNVKQRRVLFPSRTEGHAISFSRCGFAPEVCCTLQESPSNRPKKMKGGGAPKGAYLLAVPGGARRAPRRRMLPFVHASGALAFRRSTAALAAPDASGHRLNPSPALPKTRRIRRYPLPPVLVHRAPRRPVVVPVGR